MDGPDVAGGLDGDADGGFDMGFDTDFGGIDAIDGVGGLDSDLISDSLMFSFDHYDGWSDPVCDEGVCSTIEIDRPHKPNHERELSEEQKKAIDSLIKDPMRKFYGAHVVSHGYVDVMTEFARIADEVGCERIDTATPNFPGADIVHDELSDWNRWNPPFTRKKVPTGWYEGAEGSTRIVRQFWQLNKGFFHPEKFRRFDRLAGMTLEVVAVTWRYHEPGDYETRFQILVKTMPEFDPKARSFGIRKYPFRRYQAKALELTKRIAYLLHTAPPDDEAIDKRDEIIERLQRENEPAPQPTPQGCSNENGSGADVSAMLQIPEEDVTVYIPVRAQGS